MDIKEIEARIEQYNQEVMRKEYEKETLEKEITTLLDTYSKQTGVVLEKDNKGAIEAEITKVKDEFNKEVEWYTEFFKALDSGDEVKQHELLSTRGLVEGESVVVTQPVVEPVVEQVVEPTPQPVVEPVVQPPVEQVVVEPVVQPVVEQVVVEPVVDLGVTDDTINALNSLGGEQLSKEDTFATVDDLMMNLGDLKL